MSALLALLAWLFMLFADGGTDDGGDGGDDEHEDDEEDDDEDGGEDEDDEEDDDGDDVDDLKEQLAALKAERKEANKLDQKQRRKIKHLSKQIAEKGGGSDDDDDDGETNARLAAAESRAIRAEVKATLVAAGLSPNTVKLVDLDAVELDDDGDLIDPDEVVAEAKAALEEFGVAPTKKVTKKSRKPPKDKGSRGKGDKGGGGDQRTMAEKLLAQARGGDDE